MRQSKNGSVLLPCTRSKKNGISKKRHLAGRSDGKVNKLRRVGTIDDEKWESAFGQPDEPKKMTEKLVARVKRVTLYRQRANFGKTKEEKKKEKQVKRVKDNKRLVDKLAKAAERKQAEVKKKVAKKKAGRPSKKYYDPRVPYRWKVEIEQEIEQEVEQEVENKAKHKFERVPVMIYPEKAFSIYEMRPEAREALLEAIDNDETVMELQPLVWGRLNFECKQSKGTIAVGVSEKMANILSEAGILYMLDLLEQSAVSLLQKCNNLGPIGIDDIVWSILNFDKRDRYLFAFRHEIMPGIDPAEVVRVIRRQQPASEHTPIEFFSEEE